MTRRTSGTRRTTSCSKKTTPRAPGFMPTCIARKATTATPATGTGVRNGPLPAERLRKNGKASRWRCSASINRSPKRPQAQKPATLADSVGDTITLVDGRRLGWAEFGDPQGLPLFYFHGFPASRLEGKLIEAAALRNGIRVIASDRPGYGISDFQPRRRLLDWPCDVKALADRLSIDRFMILGVSGGGPYALACAHAMAPRLRAVGVVCGLGPVFEPWARSSLPWPTRLGFGLARRSKRLLRFV